MSTFNRGTVEVTDGDQVVAIAAGHLPITGAHSQQAIGAVNIGEALDWLGREGHHSDRAGDMGLVGVASPVDAPGFEGAVMFRGAVLPGMNEREALAVNATCYSAEVWPSPQHNGQLVFAGAVQCDHTAWPLGAPEALAAGAEVECVGPFCMIFGADPEPVAAEIESGCSCDAPSVGPDELADLFDVQPDPVEMVAAEVTDDDLEQVRTELAEVKEMIAASATELAELAVTVYGGENLGALNEIAGFSERLARIEELMERLTEHDDQAVEGEEPESVNPADAVTIPV